MTSLKHWSIVGFFCVLAVTSIVGASVFAQTQDSSLSEEHIARIRANCTTAGSTLERLHRSDALLRVNRGQLYESISTKLMARFNSRVALNRLDGTRLVSTAAEYERELNAFRAAYQSYEVALASALKVDCQKEPQLFYERIAEARTKRQAVHEAVERLHRYIDEYDDAFQSFVREYTIAANGASL